MQQGGSDKKGGDGKLLATALSSQIDSTALSPLLFIQKYRNEKMTSRRQKKERTSVRLIIR